jgi:hypothetical protein
MLLMWTLDFLFVFIQGTSISHHVTQPTLTLLAGRLGYLEGNVTSTGVPSLAIGWVETMRVLGLFKFVQPTVFVQFFSEPVLGNGQHFAEDSK